MMRNCFNILLSLLLLAASGSEGLAQDSSYFCSPEMRYTVNRSIWLDLGSDLVRKGNQELKNYFHKKNDRIALTISCFILQPEEKAIMDTLKGAELYKYHLNQINPQVYHIEIEDAYHVNDIDYVYFELEIRKGEPPIKFCAAMKLTADSHVSGFFLSLNPGSVDPFGTTKAGLRAVFEEFLGEVELF